MTLTDFPKSLGSNGIEILLLKLWDQINVTCPGTYVNCVCASLLFVNHVSAPCTLLIPLQTLLSLSSQFGILFNPLKSHLSSDVLMQCGSSFLSSFPCRNHYRPCWRMWNRLSLMIRAFHPCCALQTVINESLYGTHPKWCCSYSV